MNDFTKEELCALIDELDGTIYIELRQKIQFMIDNYKEHCDHDFKELNTGFKLCGICGEEFRMDDDLVYGFQFPEDGCGGFDISSVTIGSFSKSKNIGAGFMRYSYESKQEAIDASIKRLKKLKTE